MPDQLTGKKILLGVSGGIAAFKSCELLRLLVKAGAVVRVVMTEAATHFVTPLTFSALGAESVATSMWEPNRESTEGSHAIEHVSWADWADLMVVAPATANIIAKMAAGIADEVLSTHLLAYDGPKFVVPAMNVKMWHNFATKRNVEELKKQGIIFLDPTVGYLASLLYAEGRMVEPELIFHRIAEILAGRHDLGGVKIMVTAGPTVEPLDPVRYISNRSSGKMGYAVALAAKTRGAEVVLVTGPVSLEPPPGIETIHVETAEQMREAVDGRFDAVHAVVMAAAVADFRPKTYSEQKLKRSRGTISLELAANPDILGALVQRKTSQILVGFALETEDLEAAAKKKLADKKLDMVVANRQDPSDNPTQPEVGIGSDLNKVLVLVRGKQPIDLPVMPKAQVADRILDELAILLKRNTK